ncbi:hypothetical protein AQJ27_49130 [Streptomyces olivochromogenes]|uniref:Cobalt ABC transporter ATP-binding protein n=1 Tax=Streptomyces olivochromogenes TaxID=1963 RepID=A0A286PGZ1_STROL|nr:hypothetical protein AQJ27_49130 [Streptomyces olivochromogenes]GAX58820.1 cobalt ABC transporter ATP-binding protein [Streptomyces olivochromogenes]
MPGVLLLDEPPRGLDCRAKTEPVRVVDTLAAQGRTVVISTHEVEFAARAADRVVVMAEGDVVTDGPTSEVTVASPVFVPQTAKSGHQLCVHRAGRPGGAGHLPPRRPPRQIPGSGPVRRPETVRFPWSLSSADSVAGVSGWIY